MCDLERNGQIFAFSFKNVYIVIVTVENRMAKVGTKRQNACICKLHAINNQPLKHLEQDKIMAVLSKPVSLAVKCHTPGYVQFTPYDPYLDYSICELYHVGYTRCPRRNLADFGRVFLMLNYTDITQNTYIQS